jgi:hypothetical protein
MTLSPAVAHILETLRPGYPIPQSPHLSPDDAVLCPHCSAPVWSVTVEMPCARPGEGYPLLLNHQPDLWGRYEVVAPEIARYCPVYRMVEWPLPRYSSHLVDCPALIARRLEEAELRMEQMRYAAERRKAGREEKRRRMEAWAARLEDPFGRES